MKIEIESQHKSSYDHKVVICDKKMVFKFFPEVISKTGFEPKDYNLVMVKPNLCGLYHPQLRLIELVLSFFETYAQKIVIGETDSMSHTPEVQFRTLGILDMVKQFDKVKAINLMEDKILDLEVPSAHVINNLPIPNLVHHCDLLVNIPKVGTHMRTMLTCAIKNLFGLLAEKHKYSAYHSIGVDQVLADLMKIVRCDLNVADVRNKVILGVDPLTVDILACKFVGLDPLNVEYLRLVSADRNLKLEKVVNQLQIIKM